MLSFGETNPQLQKFRLLYLMFDFLHERRPLTGPYVIGCILAWTRDSKTWRNRINKPRNFQSLNYVGRISPPINCRPENEFGFRWVKLVWVLKYFCLAIDHEQSLIVKQVKHASERENCFPRGWRDARREAKKFSSPRGKQCSRALSWSLTFDRSLLTCLKVA